MAIGFSCNMLKIIKPRLCILFILMSVGILFPSYAETKYASMVVDAKTGFVFSAINQNTRNYPASLTKLMTLYLLFEHIEKGKLTLDSRLKVSRKAANRPASKLGLRKGQSLTVKDAILAIVVKSANDVATVIAESVGGNERRFALLMTSKAREIGMSRTTFRNASGLPHRGQMSTAKDMARLTRSIINDFPGYYHFFSKRSFKFQGRVYRSHNKLLKTFSGAEGMKTGYIRASGYNLITTAKRNGTRVIGVVFGGNTSRSRNRHMNTLLTRAFKKDSKKIKRKVTTKLNHKRHIKVLDKIWGVQVGAFYSRAPAEKISKNIKKKYRMLFEGGEIVIMPLKKSRKRVLYRARILGIKRFNAFKACKVLKQHQKPCMEVELASSKPSHLNSM